MAEKLLECGSTAVQNSTNQAIRPHAIIALNKAVNTAAATWWNLDDAKTWLFEGLDAQLNDNPKFEKYQKLSRRANKTTEQLLLNFYSSVQVVRLPVTSDGIGNPNLINAQVSNLYKGIQGACNALRSRKAEEHLLFTADQLSPYLQLAFNHFVSKDGLTKPFDFVKASFLNSPISSDFASNLERLGASLTARIRLQDVVQSERPTLSSIVRKLSYMAASAIMLDAARNNRLGDVPAMLRGYLPALDKGLNLFLDHHWPCEARDCCLNRISHRTGHQSKDGKVLVADLGLSQEYVCKTSSKDLLYDFVKNIETRLAELLERDQDTQKSLTQIDKARKLHRSEIRKFYNENRTDEGAVYFNNFGCLCCLMAAAEICLPCDHVLCASCVKTYGSSYESSSDSPIQINTCPLHDHPAWTTAPTLYPKPAGAGVRVLSLDG